jgi:hypothetical protein
MFYEREKAKGVFYLFINLRKLSMAQNKKYRMNFEAYVRGLNASTVQAFAFRD